MKRRIATGIGGVLALLVVASGTAAADVPGAPASAPICLDSAGFGGVYCIWPEQPRRPRNAPPAPSAPSPDQNQPPAAN